MGALILKAVSKTGKDMLEDLEYNSVLDIPCGTLLEPENAQPLSVHT